MRARDGKLSPAQYARRTSQRVETVYAQLRQGRLRATKNAEGQWRIDPSEAPSEGPEDSEDDAPARDIVDTLPTGEPWSDKIPDIEDSKAARQFYLAKLAEAEYLEKAGKLVPLEGVEQRYADDVAQVRTKILGLPSRLKGRLRLTDAQFRLVTELVEEALIGISDGSEAEGTSGDA